MYGLVNQAIQGLVTENFGKDRWDLVRQKANVKQESFLNNELYEDDITYRLAGAASEVLGLSLTDVLISFGKYWILKTAQEKYGTLMQSGGDHFAEFILNLPNFHSRVMLLYSDIKPPEFFVEKKSETAIDLHYYSTRPGLTDFMLGLVLGLGELYRTSITVNITADRRNGATHDVFEILIHNS
jgi:hypothetical protein